MDQGSNIAAKSPKDFVDNAINLLICLTSPHMHFFVLKQRHETSLFSSSMIPCAISTF